MNDADMHDCNVVVEPDVMVRMRDGVRLAQDIYRPARRSNAGSRPLGGAFPVLLERTPYDKSGVRDSERTAGDPRAWSRPRLAEFFARHGYVVVIQDCRGRHGSEGTFTKYLNEAEDGFDTVEWIRRQRWYGGAFGTFGLSYSAHTQTALATQRPEGLKAMVLDCGGLANAYRNGVRHGGAFEMKQATWAFKHARQSLPPGSEAAAAMDQEDLAEWLRRWPWKRGHSPLRWAPAYEAYLFEQLERGVFDDYWRQPALYASGYYPTFENVAVLLLSGWYDPYAQTTTDNFAGLCQRAMGATEMILGPWLHGQRSISYAGDVDFGAAATLDGNIASDYFALRLEWFDHWLKGVPRPVTPPKVRYFRMGGGGGARDAGGRLTHGGRWFGVDQWPPRDALPETWYLHASGGLSQTPPDGGGDAGFVHDPRDPVPTIGGSITSGQPIMDGGAFDQRAGPGLFGARPPWLPLAARNDVLVFQTAALEGDLEVTGSIRARLWISADTEDADFTIKLIDVYPPCRDYPQGFAMNLTDGILRCRYRDGWDRVSPLVPGQPAEIEIEPPPVSNLFAAGHRIRLDIAGSNFPRFDINPATGKREGGSQQWRLATQNVHCSIEHPSRIILPVVPARASISRGKG